MHAPGVDVVSAGFTSDTASAVKTGTSMSVPHASGVAALFLETNPVSVPWLLSMLPLSQLFCEADGRNAQIVASIAISHGTDHADDQENGLGINLSFFQKCHCSQHAAASP